MEVFDEKLAAFGLISGVPDARGRPGDGPATNEHGAHANSAHNNAAEQHHTIVACNQPSATADVG